VTAAAEHKPADWPDGPCPCQIAQTHCWLCHRDMATIRDTRLLGSTVVGEGIRFRLTEKWACAPTCTTAATRPRIRQPKPAPTETPDA
jgi:hypothetical protein